VNTTDLLILGGLAVALIWLYSRSAGATGEDNSDWNVGSDTYPQSYDYGQQGGSTVMYQNGGGGTYSA